MRDNLGQALHTIMDSTSPVHNINGWPMNYDPNKIGLHSPQEGVGIETAEDITEEIMGKTIREMEIAYQYYLDRRIPYEFPVNRPE